MRDLETESLSFAVVVLIASIPLAIEIVTTTTLALGSKVLTVRFAPLLYIDTHTHELYVMLVFIFFFGRETYTFRSKH